jgi:cytochrome b561
MAAQAGSSPHPAHSWSRETMPTALYGCIALVTVAIGVLGLSGDSWPREALESGIDVHTLFGLLLCGLILARCRGLVARLPHMPANRELSRHLSRIVYLFLYVVIGVREVIGILNSLWHGGPVDFTLLDARSRQGPDHAGFNPKDDFQMFFASGLFALIFVRVLVFTLWSRARRRAAVSKPAMENHSECASRALECGRSER